MTDAPLLVALDIDGTLLSEDGTMSDAVIEAAEAASVRGHILMLATGRSWETTHHVLDQLGITPEYVVCANGALVMKRDATEPTGYRRHLIETFNPREVLTQIRSHLADGRYMVEYPSGYRRYTQGMTDWNLENAEEVEFEHLLSEPVTRVVVVSPEHDELDFLSVVEKMGLHSVTYAIGWTAWLDIAPLGVNKSTALERVREWLDVPEDRIVAVGDGRNDIEMFQWAGRSGRAVAMGQAPDDVKAVATEVTGSIDDDGLAAVLRSL
ncbi:Cof-type HAD-IIB family hydrolase [Mycetocola manganoxydans]|uniref:Cof-type HAD-IIB family hydrolase n=1 Tax=Mycetocola manganoxydans TaxID=699879 RepID=A0A3L6ZU00_9MICO|nr:Cof-type HAD-IIB family hydrolase [Mycetocola manganoxydans]RLP71330.1 Cof-type HAD-IIB family hydrolase [Mycetocola manganoxydans]GHD45831.1 haloacid dehalogenase [Mycetocola manganoxydans]